MWFGLIQVVEAYQNFEMTKVFSDASINYLDAAAAWMDVENN